MGEHREEFFMHVAVALVVGVCAAMFTTYMQQSEIKQRTERQAEQIESIRETQEVQQQGIRAIGESIQGMRVKLNLLLQAQGIDTPIGRQPPAVNVTPDSIRQ
jgi:uncharacterized transporter YbjL